MKYLIIVATFLISCFTPTEENIGLEQKAFDYFINNLLYQNISTGQGGYLTPMIPDEINNDGLFKGINLYSSGIIDSPTIPFMKQRDYMDPEIGSSENQIKLYKEIKKNYNAALNDSIYFHIYLKNPIKKVNSYEDFLKRKDKDGIFLMVRKNIIGINDSYVQLYFKGYQEGIIYNEYSIYIVFDSYGKVTDWFMG